MSIEQTDREAAQVGHPDAPRVSLEFIKKKIQARTFGQASDLLDPSDGFPSAIEKQMSLLTICVLVMKNGFTIIGKSAPASPDRFDAEFGKKLAYEDAIRQVWPFEGYLLREQLSNGESA